MKNKDLIEILKSLPGEEDICITVKDIVSGNVLAETYDVGCRMNKNGGFSLVVAVERSRTAC